MPRWAIFQSAKRLGYGRHGGRELDVTQERWLVKRAEQEAETAIAALEASSWSDSPGHYLVIEEGSRGHVERFVVEPAIKVLRPGEAES